MKDIILVGGGGHCKACIDVIEQQKQFRISGVIDIPDMIGKTIITYPIIGCDDDIPNLTEKYKYFLITIGQIKLSKIRQNIFNNLKSFNIFFLLVISPLAYVSPHSRIGNGTIVMHGAIVNAGADIGENCIINTHAIIEHDVRIENHCHISTTAVVNGGAYIGRNSFIGSKSMIREGVTIEKATVISAGSIVMADIGR